MYVQIGSENGGVVVNLGIEGVAFHAAHRLTALRNSTLSLRLRGSGLNVELVGELIWLGATQKEAGICFKALSSAVQSDLAAWIARETQVFETAASQKQSRPDPSASIAYISGTGDKSAAPSLSGGLVFPRGMPTDPLFSSAAAEENGPWLPAPANPAITRFVAPPPQDIVSSSQHGSVSGGARDEARAQNTDSDSLAVQKESQFNQPFHDNALFEPVPIDRPYQFPTNYSRLIAPSEQATTPVPEELAPIPAELPNKHNLRKTEEIQPIAEVRASLSPITPSTLIKPDAFELWIPPAFLVVWKKGTHRQKFLLASVGAACLGIFTLILAVSHTQTSSTRPQRTTPAQQSAPPSPAAGTVTGLDSYQTAPGQIKAPAPRPPQSHRPPQPTWLDNLLGEIPEPDPPPEIGENQVRVMVWTSKSNGYYYCTNNSYYKSVLPGTFMSQGDALQSGYRSVLGEFCN